ncbi:uncharacterized protein L201_005014 [Kwoniella dendrophila CBS 6074]|uniref:Uncharacterized protein n=1 Tax=Kwoniella dendrophila CBS 6074 TaxID=1295534 RepID=A0AAX4JXY8_9TREE
MPPTRQTKTYGKSKTKSPSTSAKTKANSKPKSVPTTSSSSTKRKAVNGKPNKEDDENVRNDKSSIQEENHKEDEDTELMKRVILLLVENVKNIDWFDLAKKLDHTTLNSSSSSSSNGNSSTKNRKGKKSKKDEMVNKMTGTELRNYFNDTILPILRSGNYPLDTINNGPPAGTRVTETERYVPNSPLESEEELDEGGDNKEKAVEVPSSPPQDELEKEDERKEDPTDENEIKSEMELDHDEESQVPNKRKSSNDKKPSLQPKPQSKAKPKPEVATEARPNRPKRATKTPYVEIGGSDEEAADTVSK